MGKGREKEERTESLRSKITADSKESPSGRSLGRSSTERVDPSLLLEVRKDRSRPFVPDVVTEEAGGLRKEKEGSDELERKREKKGEIKTDLAPVESLLVRNNPGELKGLDVLDGLDKGGGLKKSERKSANARSK